MVLLSKAFSYEPSALPLYPCNACIFMKFEISALNGTKSLKSNKILQWPQITQAQFRSLYPGHWRRLRKINFVTLLPWLGPILGLTVPIAPSGRGSLLQHSSQFFGFWVSMAAPPCPVKPGVVPWLHKAQAARTTSSPLLRQFNYNKCLKNCWYLINGIYILKISLENLFFLKQQTCINYSAHKIIFICMITLCENGNISAIHIYKCYGFF